MLTVSVSYRTLVGFRIHLEGESRSPSNYYESIISTYCKGIIPTSSTIITYFLVLGMCLSLVTLSLVPSYTFR